MSEAGHAYLMCNGHQNMMESSEILRVPHGGITPRHVDIVPPPLLLPNIGVASVWSAWIEHPIVIAMKRDIEHSVRRERGEHVQEKHRALCEGRKGENMYKIHQLPITRTSCEQNSKASCCNLIG